MTAPRFVHLRVHSEYSLADSIVKVKPLVARARALDMPALALTDRANLFALVKYYRACLDAGIKPLVGVDLPVLTDSGERCRLGVMAMDDTGYRNLLTLVSGAYVGCVERGAVSREQLFERADGLLVLSGGREGDVGQLLLKGDEAGAERLAADWARAFPDRYYLELTRTGRQGEESHIALAVPLAAKLGLPVVATNDVCFLSEDDFEAHETRVCIHDGRTLDDPRRERRYSPQQYLKSAEEMAELFADLPEALDNSVEIARRCNVQVALGKYYLPNYPVPEGVSLEAFLEQEARAGLDDKLRRLEELGELTLPVADYTERLDYELGIINQMGFPGYFLIVMEFIGWAKRNDIPVGPGRGSGGGSLVAYALGITDMDPLRYDLLFERFLNPERVSMPDFDIDFCMEGRDRVIAHVSERYGQDAVSQIITFGTMAAKAVVRDVARVQGKPYGLADKLSKLIPFEVGMTLTKAVEQSKELVAFIEENDEVGEIMEMAYKLEGVVRGVGRHAGGVVIAPSALTDFVPLYVDELSGGLVSQFDKDDVESAGLVKFDFLGLKTLTIVQWAVQAVNEHRGADQPPIQIDRIPLDDPTTFELLKAAETTAVFQLESRGMKDLIKRLKPDRFDDIIALVALFRPGPLQSGAVDDYIDRKHGRKRVDYPHPAMEPVLSTTYGVMLYQEQVMQSAQVLAGFSLGQADLLRRAMGKKKPEEMAKVRAEFLDGCRERGVDEQLANDIFDLMEKFSGYAFNKSHSATYALVSFQTAWLKAHYPAEFMAATLSADMQNIDKVVTLVDEVRRMGLELTPPSVNHSQYRFTGRDRRVIYGLGAVRGVGEGPVEALVAAREADGPFVSLADFCRRVDAKRANRRVLEALIRSGAMDELAGGDGDEHIDLVRSRLAAELPDALQSAEQAARDAALGMTDMFGGVEAPPPPPPSRMAVQPLSRRERLEGEKETLGLYLTGHPIEEYLPDITQICASDIAGLRPEKGNQLVAGLVVSMRVMRSRRGGDLCFVVIDDRSARMEASVFTEAFDNYRSKIAKDAILLFEGEVQPDDYTGEPKLRVEKVFTMDEARARFSRGVLLDLCMDAVTPDLPARLKSCLEPHRHDGAGCPVAVLYQAGDGEAGARGRITLGPDWHVRPSDDLLARLRSEFGDERVRLTYAG
ncbi:MAG: DNA polymerase III subunit alpha [Gammaproteobacteria bacterium]|nr:DNA polymerase III subunit alpha [Gammaproteobacteria bacterium]MBK80131.1 DNA polymerase III subunit alpha [Gammaproteobacteria bacterium]